MGLPAAEQIAANAIVALAEGASNEPSMVVVILTGLTLVFGILIILFLVLSIQGMIFSRLDKSKKEAQEEKAQEKAPKVPVQEKAEPKPVIEDGISPQVVAAITAAVAEFSEGEYSLQSISNASARSNAPTKSERRGRWGLAGVMSDTEPF